MIGKKTISRTPYLSPVDYIHSETVYLTTAGASPHGSLSRNYQKEPVPEKSPVNNKTEKPEIDAPSVVTQAEPVATPEKKAVQAQGWTESSSDWEVPPRNNTTTSPAPATVALQA